MAPTSLQAFDQDPSDPSTDLPTYLVDFGSPEMLALICSLIDIGEMTRLLHECIAYQLNPITLASHLSQLGTSGTPLD